MSEEVLEEQIDAPSVVEEAEPATVPDAPEQRSPIVGAFVCAVLLLGFGVASAIHLLGGAGVALAAAVGTGLVTLGAVVKKQSKGRGVGRKTSPRGTAGGRASVGKARVPGLSGRAHRGAGKGSGSKGGRVGKAVSNAKRALTGRKGSGKAVGRGAKTAAGTGRGKGLLGRASKGSARTGSGSSSGGRKGLLGRLGKGSAKGGGSKGGRRLLGRSSARGKGPKVDLTKRPKSSPKTAGKVGAKTAKASKGKAAAGKAKARKAATAVAAAAKRRTPGRLRRLIGIRPKAAVRAARMGLRGKSGKKFVAALVPAVALLIWVAARGAYRFAKHAAKDTAAGLWKKPDATEETPATNPDAPDVPATPSAPTPPVNLTKPTLYDPRTGTTAPLALKEKIMLSEFTEPEGMLEFETLLERERDEVDEHSVKATQFADFCESDLPLDPSVVDSARDVADAWRALYDMVEELHLTFQNAHEEELQRLKEPRTGEEKWDTVNNDA
jgi:hypothetical protein